VKPCSFILAALLSPRPWVAHIVISQLPRQAQGRHTQKRTSHCVSVWLVRQNATFLGLHTRESRSVAHAPVALANALKLSTLNKRVRGQHHKTVLARRSLIKPQMALEKFYLKFCARPPLTAAITTFATKDFIDPPSLFWGTARWSRWQNVPRPRLLYAHRKLRVVEAVKVA
jgi:hypothetical protein